MDEHERKAWERERDQALSQLKAIVGAAEGRDLTDEEAKQYEKFEHILEQVRKKLGKDSKPFESLEPIYNQPDEKERTHTLYRFYDKENVLLYVGITGNLPQRLKNHNGKKSWWSEVENVTIRHYASRAMLEEAEKTAIATDNPKYNVQHNAKQNEAKGLMLYLSCDHCRKDVSGSSVAVIHIRYKDIHEAEEAYRGWEAGKRGLLEVNIKEIPRSARWAIHCNACNPHYNKDNDMYCEGCYWWSLDQCKSAWSLLHTTAHLLESKGWLTCTDWDTFLYRVYEQNKP